MSTFNPAQLATYEQARAVRDFLGTQVGGGVLSGDDEHGIQTVPNVLFWLPPVQQVPGIYVPPWESGPHADPVPSDGNKKFLHYRFKNGAEGMNVGLIIDKFSRYPNSPDYVIRTLAEEAASMAKS